jgi:hypothetical protein
MPDKVLCFNLNGYALGVEPEQIEKILLNKQPSRGVFTLETGVEVKRLSEYVPLPAEETESFGNILFVKDQKNFFGFTVDNVQGYLRLRGGEKIKSRGGNAPISYFVRKGGSLIPILDLHYITNLDAPVSREVVDEILQAARASMESATPSQSPDVAEEDFDRVHDDEILQAIEEEIGKRKTTVLVEEAISSEKKGMVLPLVINLVIVFIFAAGLIFYLTIARERTTDQILGGTISGVEEEVIREIRRRSEEEIAQQKQRLAETRSKLTALMEERDFFLKNQDKLLAERETTLMEEYQQKLEDARRRLLASGVQDFDGAFADEQRRLEREYRKTLDQSTAEIEKIKADYEKELASREDTLRREVAGYSERIDEIEQQLIEEQAKLEQAELQAQNVANRQQEYVAFRRQLSGYYSRATDNFAREEYAQAVGELRSMLPVIESAKRAGIGNETELLVEEELVKNIISMAENQQSGSSLNRMAQSSYDKAVNLEKTGDLTGALSLYYTAYSISNNRSMKDQSLDRANVVMDRIYSNRVKNEAAKKEGSANNLFNRAIAQKNRKQYAQALGTLEELVKSYPETSKVEQSFEEIKSLNRLILMQEEQQRIESLNRQAALVMKQAEEAYDQGLLSESLDRYGELISKYYASDYVGEALKQITRISEVMRSVKATPQVVFGGTDARTGVIIQIPAENTFLFNLGLQDGLKQGDVMGVFRKEGETYIYIGSVKVFEVYPTVSRGRTVHIEKPIKVGDLISPS